MSIKWSYSIGLKIMENDKYKINNKIKIVNWRNEKTKTKEKESEKFVRSKSYIRSPFSQRLTLNNYMLTSQYTTQFSMFFLLPICTYEADPCWSWHWFLFILPTGNTKASSLCDTYQKSKVETQFLFSLSCSGTFRPYEPSQDAQHIN